MLQAKQSRSDRKQKAAPLKTVDNRSIWKAVERLTVHSVARIHCQHLPTAVQRMDMRAVLLLVSAFVCFIVS